MPPLIEALVLARIDADLAYKSATLSGVVDLDSGQQLFTTTAAADIVRSKLRPWDESVAAKPQYDEEDLAAMWLKEYGDKIGLAKDE